VIFPIDGIAAHIYRLTQVSPPGPVAVTNLGIHDFALGHGFCEHAPEENVIMHPTGFDRKDGAFNPIHKALLPPIPSLTEQQRSRAMFAMVAPMMAAVSAGPGIPRPLRQRNGSVRIKDPEL